MTRRERETAHQNLGKLQEIQEKIREKALTLLKKKEKRQHERLIQNFEILKQ